MTAPLEVLKEYQKTTWPWAAVRCDHLSAAIAAIEERDAEIEKARGGIAMMNECNAALARDVDELRDQLATLARQLAEARVELEREASAADRLHRERDEATAQRDAMRGALEEIRDHGYFEDLIGRALGAL